MNAIFYANSNKKSIEKLIFPAFGKSWFWRMLFSIQILIKKVLKNCFFPAFGKVLVLGNVFLFKFKLKKYLKIDFFSFGFWRMLFSIQILIKKVSKKMIFSAFGQILFGFGERFFLFKF